MNSDKMRQQRAALELKSFLDQEHATLQKDIATKLQRLQSLVVQRMEDLCFLNSSGPQPLFLQRELTPQSATVKPERKSNNLTVSRLTNSSMSVQSVASEVGSEAAETEIVPLTDAPPDSKSESISIVPEVMAVPNTVHFPDQNGHGSAPPSKPHSPATAMPPPHHISQEIAPPLLPNASAGPIGSQSLPMVKLKPNRSSATSNLELPQGFVAKSNSGHSHLGPGDGNTRGPSFRRSHTKRDKRMSKFPQWHLAGRCQDASVHSHASPTKSQNSKDTDIETLASRRVSLFADAGVMKEKLREEMLDRKLHVDKYKDEGLAQAIARSDYFEFVTLVMIALNALWMAVDVDYNRSLLLFDAHPIFILAENVFCMYFVGELTIRFVAFRRKMHCRKDKWFCFDLLLVSLMVTETWFLSTVLWYMNLQADNAVHNLGNTSVFRVLRFMRLFRVARVAHLLFLLPELTIMFQGIGYAARTVFFALALILSVIFIFAICFTELTKDLDIGRRYFRTVPHSLSTLIIYGTMPDADTLINDVNENHVFFGLLVMLFISITTFTLMNMLVGILVGVMGEIASVEKERAIIASIKDRLEALMATQDIDVSGNKQISEAEFEHLISHPEAITALGSVGVDVVGLADVQDFIFSDGENLTFPDFVELLLNLRGTNHSTVKDVVDLRMFLVSELDGFEHRVMERLEQVGSQSEHHRMSTSSAVSIEEFG